MILLDGKSLSDKIKLDIKTEVEGFLSSKMRKPTLAAILIGDNTASQTYIHSKIKACEYCGIESLMFHLEESIQEEDLIQLINDINSNPDIDGLLVQLPLPKHIDETLIIERIAVSKDVDGFHPTNIGRMAKNLDCIIPATPFGILKLIEFYKIETSGKKVVVIGRSNIVGSPMSILMGRNSYPGNSTVTLCHSKTVDLAQYTLEADIIISAVGITHLIKKEMIKDGAVIIDVGMNSLPDETKKSGYRLVGDVDFEDVKDKCSYITPVPGGVGPMTIAGLLLNCIKLYKQHLGIQ